MHNDIELIKIDLYIIANNNYYFKLILIIKNNIFFSLDHKTLNCKLVLCTGLFSILSYRDRKILILILYKDLKRKEFLNYLENLKRNDIFIPKNVQRIIYFHF